MQHDVSEAKVTNDGYVKSVVDRARVARLATVDSENKPHLVPVVFVFDSMYYYIPLDEKAKKEKPEKLKRVKNVSVIFPLHRQYSHHLLLNEIDKRISTPHVVAS